MVKTFDVIVIGGGSGLDIAVEAAERGLKTAIIEQGPLGGTCLNRGCIPSKMIIHAAEVMQTIAQSSQFGIDVTAKKVNFSRVTGRASTLVDADARSIEHALRSEKNPTLFRGNATFVGQKILNINGEKITAKKIVIAAGARPTIPPIPRLDTVPYLTSTEALRLKTFPKSMIIIGGGYIAAELGNFYATLGCKVTIIQRGPLLIPREDKDVAELFMKLWKEKGNVLVNTNVVNVQKQKRNILVTVQQGNVKKTLHAEKLLIATGVTPNTDSLNIAKTGVKTTKNGFIQVNKFMETSVPGIWALGDIAGVYLFKHSANLEAQYVLHNILGTKRAVPYYPMPHAIFTSPQIAGVGMTEQEAQEQNKEYVMGRYDYKDTGMGAALEEKNGFVKLIVERKTKEILGCHIIGPEASTLIHEVVVAMKADRRKALDILRTAVLVHPALSEVVQRAALSVPV